MNVNRINQSNVQYDNPSTDPEHALDRLLNDKYDQLLQRRQDSMTGIQSHPNNQSQQKTEAYPPYVPHHPGNLQQESEDYQNWQRNRPDNPLNRPGNQPLKQVIEKFVYGNKDMPNFSHGSFEQMADYMEKNMLPTLKNEIAKSTLPKAWKETLYEMAQAGIQFIKHGDMMGARSAFEQMLWAPASVPPGSGIEW